MRRIMYFPDTASLPQFMWRSIDRDTDTDYPEEKVIADDLMGGGVEFQTPMLISRVPIPGYGLGYNIVIRYDVDIRRKYPDPNPAINTATAGRHELVWKGPIYAECGIGSGPEITTLEDVDMNTYADLVAFFTSYQNTSANHRQRRGPKLDAIKLTWTGHRETYGGDVYQPVKVPASRYMFDSEDGIPQISKRIGMPIYTIKTKTDKEANLSKQPAASMNITIDLPSSLDTEKGQLGFGSVPVARRNNVGNVLLVRTGRKPLNANDAEAFGAF
jgi:hypothetical protein